MKKMGKYHGNSAPEIAGVKRGACVGISAGQSCAGFRHCIQAGLWPAWKRYADKIKQSFRKVL